MNAPSPSASESSRASRHGRLRNAVDRFLRPGTVSRAGSTPFEVVHQDELVSLRHYPPLEGDTIRVGDATLPIRRERHRIPLVIVAPLAVTMDIYDLFPDRSFVRFLLASGFDVYLIDWGRPTHANRRDGMSHYVGRRLPDLLARVRRHAGTDELSLHGWSMGGHFAMLYAGLGIDPNVKNLVVVGSYANSHANGVWGAAIGRLDRLVPESLTPDGALPIPRAMLPIPGWANSLGFRLMNPAGLVRGYADVIARLHDRDYVVDHATNASFINDMVGYPGGVVSDLASRFLLRNELARGTVRVGRRTSDLGAITCPILVLAGATDTIATPDAVRHVLDVVGSDDGSFHEVPGGHMGIVGGRAAPETAWRITADWLGARSN